MRPDTGRRSSNSNSPLSTTALGPVRCVTCGKIFSLESGVEAHGEVCVQLSTVTYIIGAGWKWVRAGSHGIQ
jgi:hypothetical protein